MSPRRTLPAVSAAAVLGALMIPAAAGAAVARPAAPSGMRVVAATASSITVQVDRTAHAHAYRLYTSTTRSDLFTANISHALASKVSRSPRLTISGLTQRSVPYFYRVVAINQRRQHFSEAIGEVGLQPSRPAGLTATANASRTFLTWGSGPATGFRIEQATNPAMTAHHKTYTILGPTPSFTPYGLHAGTTYWFRVRALNERTPSAASAPVSARAQSSMQPVSVMTYNVLEADLDGRHEGSGVVAPWDQRKLGVVRFIQQASPDVIAVQEAAAWVKRVKGPRQIDSLRSALGGAYALAHTEVPPSQPYYKRTADYILYRKDAYAAVGSGDHWSLGYSGQVNHWAAYQVLRNRTTGAKFLMVGTHLLVPHGHEADLQREQQTKRLVHYARAYAHAHGNLPIVYAGDWNSDQFRHHPDGPSVVMNSFGIPKSSAIAQHLTNARFNTANGYVRHAPSDAAHIDDVFVSPGIAVRSWRELLHLSHGHLVGVIPSDHNPVVANLEVPYQSR
ncbi:MAG TPA: endonuclease/exonuclease/phosphatase family protein [Mycobacteriales bacterium]|nr:endonuclease/exonuclease/phosphatase family protein [Mycobacteriales bacterium]